MNRRLWGAPLALGMSTSIGLVSALLGDGWWDAISTITLGAPVAVGLYYGRRRTSSKA